MADIYDLEARKAAKAAAKKRRTHQPRGDWRDDMLLNGNGKPYATLGNAVLALRHAPEWSGVFAWNDFSARAEVVRGRLASEPRALGDNDISAATAWLNQVAEIAVPSRITAEAIRFVADAEHFHPVRDYLSRLEWDRTPRLDLWLSDHLGAQDTPLHRAFAAKWMIGLVGRIFRPGCQFDTALIFESRQGFGKSSALRTLGGAWFTDHLADLTNKDALQQLQGVWIIEIAELDSIRRAETHKIKSFLSTRVDRFRPPYGMMPAEFPRQCGFGGTINPGSNGYLRDETGARRFWTVACGDGWENGEKADISSLAAVRDQLWAEAVVRFHAGEVWHLDSDTLEEAQSEAAEERQEDDPRERKIQSFLWGKPDVHMDEILGHDCLQIPVEKWSRALRIEIGLVLSAMKWRRKRVRYDDGRREYRYEKPCSP